MCRVNRFKVHLKIHTWIKQNKNKNDSTEIIRQLLKIYRPRKDWDLKYKWIISSCVIAITCTTQYATYEKNRKRNIEWRPTPTHTIQLHSFMLLSVGKMHTDLCNKFLVHMQHWEPLNGHHIVMLVRVRCQRKTKCSVNGLWISARISLRKKRLYIKKNLKTFI